MNSKNDYLLGIDIGTGSIKVIAINKNGHILRSIQNPYKIANGVELDPEKILEVFFDSIKQIKKLEKGNLISITLSSFMHGLMLIDKNNLPLTNIITWADNRSEIIASKLRINPRGQEIYKQTGTPIHAMSPLCKIIWFKVHKKDIFRNAYKLISIKEYLWFRIFNKYEIDYSIASATGLFNTKELDWNNDSLKIAGIKAARLSTIVPCTFSRTYTGNDPYLSSLYNIPICIGSSDGCMANVGSYIKKPSQAALTIGTSGAVRLTTSKAFHDFKSMMFDYVIDKNTHIIGGPVNNGGNVILWMIKTFLKKDKPSAKDFDWYFSSIQKISVGSDGLIFLPYIYGERAPLWDEKASGAFIGIKDFHTTEHFLRAALEGICFALCSILKYLPKAHLITDIHISGGFIKEPTYTQMLADITGKKIKIVFKEDASALGAAIFGKNALGIKTSSKLVSPKVETFLPSKDSHNIYKEYFKIFKELYTPLKSSLHTLSSISESKIPH